VGSTALAHVGTYRRRVRASAGRIWENVLDWEHLPWLHRATFCDVRLIEARRDGWRVSAGLQPAAEGHRIGIETRLEQRECRYLTLTTDGPGQGTEIWTRLEPAAEDCTDIEVRFLVPGVPPGGTTAIRDAYVRLYTRLWDEDEAMMTRRAEMLSRRPSRPTETTVDLGSIESLRSRLPLLLELDGCRYRLVDLDGEIIAHSTTCPHLLGPLEHAAISDGCVRCPWHGYRFDVRTGYGIDRPDLHLGSRPDVRVDPRTRTVTVTTRA
jgi:nitrite reductase/ring-hydroxylating ferredoxin subunit